MECKETLEELLKHRTVYGLNHIYTARSRTSKSLWLFLYLLGFCGFSVNLVFIVQRYLSNPILISHVVDNEPFIWPDLTFCNPTAPYVLHTSSALNHWQKTLARARERVKVISTQTRLFGIIKDYNATDQELEETAIAMSTVDPSQLQLDNFNKHVLFYGHATQPSGIYMVKEYANAGVAVEDDDMKTFFTTQYVQIRNNIPCHTFQVDRSKQLQPKDLNMLIFIVRFNYLSYQIMNSSYIFRSIFLYINNKDNLPQKDGILLLPGFNNELSIKQTRHVHNSYSRTCRNNVFRVPIYDAMMQSVQMFEGDFEDCRKIASQKIYVQQCSCYSPFLPLVKMEGRELKLCLNASIFDEENILRNANCMASVYEMFKSKGSFDPIEEKECGEYRPIKCNDTSYEVEQRKEMWIELWSNAFNDRRRQFIQETYQPLFTQHWLGRDYVKEMRDDVAMLIIRRHSQFGDSFKEEVEYPLSELISDVGGLLGLWLGLSVVGLFEIIEFVYLITVRVVVKDSKQDSIEMKECDIIEATQSCDISGPNTNEYLPFYEMYINQKLYKDPNTPINGYIFPLQECQRNNLRLLL